MNILLIGGTGNISSEVSSILFSQGNRITVANTGKHPVPSRYHHLVVDRTGPFQCTSGFSELDFDVLIDFFAFVPEHIKTVYKIFKRRIKQYIFISSATVYQKPHKTIPITEKVPRSNPFWKYAQDKIACEEYLESIQGTEFPVTIVRPSHTFGQTWIPSPLNGNDFTVASRILKGEPIVIHDNGESLWTLTSASDFATGFCGLVGNDSAIGEAIHITSDEYMSWNKIYEIIGTTLGKQPSIVHIPTDFINKIHPDSTGPLKGDKAENGVFDNSKIKRFVPHFQCRKNFKTAIKESIEWFQKDPSRMIISRKQNDLVDFLIDQWKNR